MMTYFRMFVVFFGMAICLGCRSQSQSTSPYALEEGAYTGENNMSSGTVTMTYKPFYGTQVTPLFVNTSEPSPYGDMVIKRTGVNEGSYSFVSDKSLSGTWRYDAEKDRLSFTGKLKDALQAYKVTKDYYSLTFHLKNGPNVADYKRFVYTKKASEPKPSRPKPNGALGGTMTIMQGKNTTLLFDVASGQTSKRFSGGMASTNASLETVTLTNTGDPYHFQVGYYDKNGKSVIWNPDKVKSFNWPIDTYQLAVLDPTQTKLAVIGTIYTTASYPDFPFDYKVAVINKENGTAIGALKVEQKRYVKPTFFKDGRLLYAPSDGGLAITDRSYRSGRKIYNNAVGCMALSRDEKTILINEGKLFYTMKADGPNKQQVICGGEALAVEKGEAVSDVIFSPDGRYAAFTYGFGPSYYIIAFPLDGGPTFFIKDPYGEDIVQNNPVMNWN